jgi:Fe-S cluster assembly ATP-binding protein
MALLEIVQLVFGVGGRAILEGVDLAVGDCEIHALLGTNGAGKTTLARIVMGCAGYPPTSGTVRFLGREIGALPMHERARLGLTMAWQEPARIEGLPVCEYLALGRTGADPAQYLEQVGLEPGAYLHRALDKTLSGGERKRIELASIIAMKPRLAILDEPAAGIDLPSMEEIEEVILSLKRAGGSVLLITHVEPVARIADRASYLCDGRIVFTGDPVKTAERYKARRCVTCDGKVCAG